MNLTINTFYFGAICTIWSFILYAESPNTHHPISVEIRNDKHALQHKVTKRNMPVPILRENGQYMYPKSFSLTLISEIESTKVNDNTLQATSVELDNKTAFVSYNFQGDKRIGAIQAIDLDNDHEATLAAELVLGNADVHDVAFGNKTVYASLASNDDITFTSPAVLYAIEYKNDAFNSNKQEFLQLDSFAATSVTYKSNNEVFATSGATGAVYALEGATGMSIHDSVDLTDARWVAFESTGDERVVALQGTSGQISVFEYSNDAFTLQNTFSFTGATDEGAKSTVQIVNERAFIAAGTDGVKILSINTGKLVGSISTPTGTGLLDSEIGANAVAVFEDLLFVSNGAAGVYVIQGDIDFSTGDSEDDLTLTTLGKLEIGGSDSVNHIFYDDGFLLIAAGLGGFKVLEFEE